MMLRALQQPSYIDGLLKSLAKSMDVVPAYADAALDLDGLPAELRQMAIMASEAGQSWCAWIDKGFHVWLFVAEMSLPLSRERGSPVLELKYYREHGLRESGRWVIDRDAKWSRCTD